MADFKVPAPDEHERFEYYISRVMAELERWVNEHYRREERDAHR